VKGLDHSEPKKMQYASRHGCVRLHDAVICILMAVFARKVADIICRDGPFEVAEADCGIKKAENFDGWT